MHIFNNTCFACVCSFQLAVVIRVRPALSFDQYGLLASTACTFLRRLMFTLCWHLLKPARLCGGRPLLGCLGCLLEAPGPPREVRSPEALQGGGLGRLGLSLGSLRTSFGRLPGPHKHPKVSRGGANMRPTAPQLPEGDLGGGSGVWGAAPAPPPAPAGPDSTGTCQGNLARL